jgi:hypothetical protein
MDWNGLLTYGEAPEKAFETICNQLFRRFLQRTEGARLLKFRVVNSAGGDGGVESYGGLIGGEIVAVQSKWFRNRMEEGQFGQIEKSINTALRLRPDIKKYIVCVPRNFHSLKYGRGKKGEGKKPVEHHEDNEADAFFDKMSGLYPGVTFEWWCEADIELELTQKENEGVRKVWFEKEVITHDFLERLFLLQKKGWLHDRYIPELHGQGVIKNTIDHLHFNKAFQERARTEILKFGEAVDRIRRSIDQLRDVNDYDPGMNPELKDISAYLSKIATRNVQVYRAVAEGNEMFTVDLPASLDVSGTFDILSQWPRGNKLRQPLSNVLTGLLSMQQRDPATALRSLQRAFGQSVRLILGDGGTGKTHGLARAVEEQLAAGAPAVIVQAKGAPCRNWDEIIRSALQLDSWAMQDILVALEAQAEVLDRRRAASLPAGAELEDGSTKVLIAVDGLEEDLDHWDQWYQRIRESEVLAKTFPKVRFIFSARTYFHNAAELPDLLHFKVVHLPPEGDVPVRDVAAKYFTHFDISGVRADTVKGIGRLFGLRLFCDLHQGRRFQDGEEIVTAEYDLLNEKIRRVEEAFARVPGVSVGSTRTPVGEALEVVANCFYGGPRRVNHDELARKLKISGIDYLPVGGVDWVIDHLVNHGFIVRLQEDEVRMGRKVIKAYYTVSYEPIVELLIAARITEEIRTGTLDRFPPHTRLEVVRSVCQQLFEKDTRLIGEGGFLTAGFAGDTVVQLQLETLSRSPKGSSARYVDLVEAQFLAGAKGRKLVLEHLILPASVSSENQFGAEFLHGILSRQPSVFARDKIWVGPDMFDAPGKDTASAGYWGLPGAFKRLDASDYKLPPDASHNETPLVYAWALSTLDQSFRDRIRRALFHWALEVPDEFLLLLTKIFSVADPQIQEDMASITLGLAGKLKNRSEVCSLALWALKIVFVEVLKHRNVIVRHGFQAIVERAYQFGLISESEVTLARPARREVTDLLPLAESAVLRQEEEIYPIVHDLAWYVIKEAFKDFLQYQRVAGDQKEDQDSHEARELLDRYRRQYGKDDLFGRAWAMAGALAYIRQELGFDRTTGNGRTLESHGSKSSIFTYEEKYTWLAVHYLSGYLSDYVPLTADDAFLNSYSQIVHIPNPAETASASIGRPAEWWIPETLSEELNADAEIEEELQRWIEQEPAISWAKWLEADGKDFPDMDRVGQWVAIYNWTALHDSSEAVYTALDATACLIKRGSRDELLTLLKTDPGSLRFADSLDRLKCLPDADTYTNPSDLVWMSWIGEVETGEVFHFDGEKRPVEYTVTRVMTHSIEGEKEITIPSKALREMLNIVEMDGCRFNDQGGTCVAFRWEIDEEQHDQQELVFVGKEAMTRALTDRDVELVWFVDLWKRKNPSKEELKDVSHVQRGRKYFIWREDGQYKGLKFWDDEHL